MKSLILDKVSIFQPFTIALMLLIHIKIATIR